MGEPGIGHFMRFVAYTLTVLLSALPCAAEYVSLVPGQVFRVKLGEQPPVFKFNASVGQCVRLSIAQGAIDLAVLVRFPDGNQLDYDGFDSGEEPVTFSATESGIYSMSVRAASSKAAQDFAVRFKEAESCSPSDLIRNNAIRQSSDAKRLVRAGKLQPALEAASSAVELWSQLADPAILTAALIRKGGILYRIDRKTEALGAYSSAIQSARQSRNRGLLAEALNNAALCNHEVGGDSNRALADLQEAIDLWQSSGIGRGVAAARNNRGLILSQSGEFRKAAEEYLDAASAFGSGGDRRSEAAALSNLALAYARLGEDELARTRIEESVAILRKLDVPVDLARVLTSAAYVYRNSGSSSRLTEAERAGTEAVRLLEGQPNDIARADAFDNLGLVLAERSEFEEALRLHRQALELYGMVDMRGRANALAHAGSMEGELNQFEQAMVSLTAAESLYRTIEMPDGVVATLGREARVHIKNNQLLSARAELAGAVQLIESLRTRITGDDFRTHFLSERGQFFIDYVGVLMRLHKSQPAAGYDRQAFDAAELARARGLLDLVAIPRDQVAASLGADLRQEFESIQKLVDYRAGRANRVISAVPPPRPEVAEQARQDLRAALESYRQIEARIEERAPVFAAFNRPRPVPLVQIQAELDPATLLLAVWLAPEHSYAWAVSKSGLTSYELPSAAEIERYAVLATPSRPDPATRAKEARAWISRVVLAPALRTASARRVALVVTGPLQTFPFAAAPDPLSPSVPFGLTHEIVYVPSLAVIRALRARGATEAPARTAIAYIDPIFSRTDSRVSGSRSLQTTRDLSRLSFTRRLPAEFQKYVPRSELSIKRDFAASREQMLVPGGLDAKHVLIASHVQVDSKNPELSEIVLSQVNERGDSIAGSVRLADLYFSKTNAETVTIAGCSSGRGPVLWGEGALSFARAFFYAGAKRVLTTAWDVEEEPTIEFLKVFYRELLGKHARPSFALQVAERAIYERPIWKDAYFFAPFFLYDDWQ
jgi:tetratricopeptide (TPR) repeat protein